MTSDAALLAAAAAAEATRSAAALAKAGDALEAQIAENERLTSALEDASTLIADQAVQILRLMGERDEAQIGKRRAEQATLPALFLLLGDAQDMPISGDEYAAIFDTCLAAEEQTPIPLPASCLVDGRPELRQLFRLAEDLRREYRGQPVTFYLRGERDGVEAAIMCGGMQG